METENGNGRVTLALVKQTQEQTNALLKDFIEEQRKFNAEIQERMRLDELSAQARETRLQAVEKCQGEHDQSIEALKSSDRKWGMFTGLLAVAGSIISYFFKP